MTRGLAGALAAAIMATGAGANAAAIAIQSGYPPLQFTDAAPIAFGETATGFETTGDDTMARLHAAMTAYQETQAVYSDFGDVTQRLAGLPTSPRE